MIHLPILAIIAPLGYAFLVQLLELVSNRARRVGVVLCGAAQIAVLILLIPRVAAEEVVIYHLGGWGPRMGIVLMVDGFSLLFALLSAVGIWLVSLYSLDYVEAGEYRYFVLLFIVSAGVTGMLLTGDLFNLYVFFELASMASFPLIAYARTPGSVEAAFRYMVYSTIAATFILLAIGLTYGATGSLNLEQAAEGLRAADPLIRRVVLGLLVVGFSIKMALFPFHAWLPEAYTRAPAPITALLSGVLSKTGVYALVRLLLVFGQGMDLIRLEMVLLNLGAITVVAGHWLAMGQANFKRALAYSSIAHLGIIAMGLGVGTVAGLAGMLSHTINHMVMKSAVFFAIGRLGFGRGHDTVHMKGTARRAPLATLAFIASALSLIGVPPFAGFIGKWEITLDVLRQQHFVLALAIPLGTLLSAVYFGRMVQTLFSESDSEAGQAAGGGRLTGAVLIAGAAGCLIPFLLWQQMAPVLLQIATSVRS